MADLSDTDLTKICTRCRKLLAATLVEFPPLKIGRYGLHPCCRPCKRASDAEMRARPDQKVRQKAWRDANKDTVRHHNAKWRSENTSTAHTSAWRACNLEYAREKDRERRRKRRRDDPAFLLMGRLSTRLNSMLKNKGGQSSEAILGYSRETLRCHIERQFTSGMSWELVLSGKIEIDHILPVSHFNICSVDDPDFHVCWGLHNLRPMWSADNRAKGGKVLTLL